MRMEIANRENWTLPNAITTLRIVGTAGLMFISPLSTAFYVVYSLTGLTDLLDGWIARKTHTTTKLGAKLDSIADLLFYLVMLLRILPVLYKLLSTDIWYFVGAIVLLRVVSYGTAAIKYRQFASLHTPLNKITGFAMFCVPYALQTTFAVPVCWIVCGLSGVSSAHELILHITGKTEPSKKTENL